MKALFVGNVAADTAEGIRAELPPDLDVVILADPQELARSPAAAADADILVGNHWRADYPPVPHVKLVQSVATGIELIDLKALPAGAAICNSFGHETAIAEYVVMAMLALHHRFFEIAGEFRARASWRSSWVQSGVPHGEVRGSTLGIVGYGRVGREVARRAAPFGCRILAANRSPREPDGDVERVYPLTALDEMLPLCDTLAICTALGPETTGLIDALSGGRLGGAAIDVWWQYPTPEEPNRRGSRHPFHELPNVIVTPHNSGWTAGMVRRRWDEIADNINRFCHGDSLINLVTTV